MQWQRGSERQTIGKPGRVSAPRPADARHRSVDTDSQNVRGAPVNRYPVGFACQ
ncbi:hypothetical protein BLA18112_01308 [Burkholderia lata]|uniref:Uncharacterized protein n=1 Tax=Burkholderia lata (strain ATCC 17760 / DSM 23089 / LMG 22485 / NCIMB 9086 / R18194 / 383) TaxID=482957 RepID=A0A6P2TQZ2_BURL3|nr:hypothetical protein BLA18112_01308 [Burkholderia lata]